MNQEDIGGKQINAAASGKTAGKDVEVMSIRLIASDLDGTLLTDQKTLSPETVKTLRWAACNGIYPVPVKGRSYTEVPDLIKDSPGVRVVIQSTGGAVLIVASGGGHLEGLV